MRLSFKFKNGDNFILSEEETRSVFKQINYFKVLSSITISAGFSNRSIKIMDREIRPKDLKSVEVFI
jgi:hypothetical protein